ncbi:MAG: hypothetical protein KDB80_13500 [Planctomycetes bacterium]|nr:hypothetical protein [Planctomycetota bacterium]
MIRPTDWLKIAAAVACTGFGILVGWQVAPPRAMPAETTAAAKQADPAKEHGHSHASGAEHDHGSEPEPDDEGPALSSATLTRLGVVIEQPEPRPFAATHRVFGTITTPPEATRALFAPVGGFVDALRTRAGDVVPAGHDVVTMIRDSIGRVRLEFTSEILQPGQEERHAAVLAVRRTAGELAIAQAELARIETFTGDQPVVPREREIELRYALRRAEMAYEHARHELARHGLSKEQIEAVIGGGHLPPVSAARWKRALTHNGIWTESAESVYLALPEAIRDRPFCVATLGELAAGDLLTPDVTQWLREAKNAWPHIEALGALLQRGTTLAELDRLVRAGALDPAFGIRAPDDAPDWDVIDVVVRTGARVEAGDTVATLRDQRRLWLELLPEGREIGIVTELANSSAPCTLRPLIPGSGPVVEDAKVAFVDRRADGRTKAIVDVANARTTPGSRTWSIQPGVRYALHAPVARFENSYVLPREALLKDGAATVVLLQHEDHFETHEVVPLHQDAEFAVIPASGVGSIPDGARVVVRGAFALRLALRQGDEEPAGHGHSHGM